MIARARATGNQLGTLSRLFCRWLWLPVRAAATIPLSERLATNSGPHP
jgi:hypothetical protein